MNHMKNYIVFLSALLVICGCRQEYHRLLNIESYIQERPDSALVELRTINKSNLKSAQERALYSLLTTMALDKNYIDITDLSEIEPAVSFYRRHKKGGHYCTALFYKGRINYNGGDFSSAVSSFQEAEKWTDSPYWRSMIFSHLGYTYNKCFNNSEEIACAEKALEIVKEINNPHAIQQSMCALAAAYLNNRRFRQADSLLVSLCSAEPPFYSAYPQRADLMIKQPLPDYEEIKRLFEIGIENNVDMTMEYFSEYAYALYKTGDEQRADAIFRQICQTGKEIDVWLWKGKMLEDEGDFQAALEDRKTYDILADSLVREKLSQSVFKAQAAHYKLESELATQKRRQTVLWAALTLLIFLLIASYLIGRFRRRQQTLTKDLERLEMIADESESMLKLAREDLISTKSDLHDTETKLLELRRLYARTYQAQFAEIGQMFDYCRTGTSLDREVIENYKERTKQIVRELHQGEKSPKDFEDRINRELDNIMLKIRTDFPELKESDYRFLSYVIVGFDATTRAILLDETTNNMRVKKARLLKKIRSSETKNSNLYSCFLSH